VVSSAFGPLVFLGDALLSATGMLLWGVGMGAQETVMKAAIAEMVPTNRRGSAYGLFNMGYGFCWFVGSALLGYLYDVSRVGLVVTSVGLQLASIPLFVLAAKQRSR
jgi:MFS family permease